MVWSSQSGNGRYVALTVSLSDHTHHAHCIYHELWLIVTVCKQCDLVVFVCHIVSLVANVLQTHECATDSCNRADTMPTNIFTTKPYNKEECYVLWLIGSRQDKELQYIETWKKTDSQSTSLNLFILKGYEIAVTLISTK